MPDVREGVPNEEDPEILNFAGAYNAHVLSEEQTEVAYHCALQIQRLKMAD